MEVREVMPGQIFETLTDAGVPTGNVYRAGKQGREHTEGKQIAAWRRFRQGMTWVAASNLCRVLDPSTTEGDF